MASVVNDPNGRKRILFVDGEGERKTIRLGKAKTKAAESFARRVEALLADIELQQAHDADLCAWLNSLSEKVHERVVRAGLADPREPSEAVTLGMLLERFDAAAAVKAGTRTTYKQALEMLRARLGEGVLVDSITAAQADEWRKAIAEPVVVVADNGEETTKRLAPATVAKRVKVAKAVFAKAVKWGMIPTSPFAHLRVGSMANPDRAFYVSPEAIGTILASCPDLEWRAIVALSRFAGLRCPSEHGALKWGDLNWDRGRLTIRSSKTEGHEGRGVRVVPIAPELRPILQDLFDATEPGTVPVLPRLQDASVNLRTQFERIITSAGLKPWPRLFHNLRASCECDWVERFPDHVVANWLGHSPTVARRHYLQTRDTHFDLAAGVAPGRHAGEKSGAENGAQAAQNAAQHATATTRGGRKECEEKPVFSGVSQADANEREAKNDPEGIRTLVPTVKG